MLIDPMYDTREIHKMHTTKIDNNQNIAIKVHRRGMNNGKCIKSTIRKLEEVMNYYVFYTDKKKS